MHMGWKKRNPCASFNSSFILQMQGGGCTGIIYVYYSPCSMIGMVDGWVHVFLRLQIDHTKYPIFYIYRIEF